MGTKGMCANNIICMHIVHSYAMKTCNCRQSTTKNLYTSVTSDQQNATLSGIVLLVQTNYSRLGCS
jgi:hypothetical protein